MKGDFTRDTFDPGRHFTRVLMQQGRVQLDADWNEQASILRHFWQTLAADLIGPHGGPAYLDENDNLVEERLGFKILPPMQTTSGAADFSISKGHYYVDGMLCVNEKELLYSNQPAYPGPGKLDDGSSYLVYLDVWERHVTHLETRHPIREVGLGGPDTATRVQLVCQVKALESYDDAAGGKVEVPQGLSNDNDQHRKDAHNFCMAWLENVKLNRERRGYLKADVLTGGAESAACVIPPDSRYRGLENQLYRVEIHQDGTAGQATFKFSRDNGSVVFPLARAVQGAKIYLEHLGRDARFGLQKGDWVEIVDDDYALGEQVAPLLQVDSVDPVDRTVTLSGVPTFDTEMAKHPILRRWDQKAGVAAEGGLEVNKDGVVPVNPPNTSGWHNLEDGIQIQFLDRDLEDADNPPHKFKAGDYWLIPARTATGDIEWPKVDPDDADSAAMALPPRGVRHYYAPLAIITIPLSNENIISCQKRFLPLTDLYEELLTHEHPANQ